MGIDIDWTDGSAADETIAILRERIVEERLAPGSRLSQRRLADELNVTRATVGEALRALRRERLVELAGSGGAMRVCTPDAATLARAYAVRCVIDGLAARLAAGQADASVEVTRAVRQRGAAGLAEQRRAIRSNDRLRFLRADIAFHAGIVDAARNPTLRDHWAMIRFTGRSVLVLELACMAISVNEHAAILDAVCNGEPDRADRAARQHAATTERYLRETVA